MREAKFAAAKPIAEKPPASVTKIDSVMTLDTVTKIPVTKIGRGRPRLGDKPQPNACAATVSEKSHLHIPARIAD
jgi:hypothetical protein